jgi:hypothetical protein
MSSVFDDLAQVFVGALGDSTPATYTTKGGAIASPVGIFEDPAALVELGGGEAAQIRRLPKFSCAEAALPAGAGQGDSLTVRGRDYTVRAALPDGQGMVDLHLDKV